MILFKTERLIVKEMQDVDFEFFTELVSAPEIINPIPQKKWSILKIKNKFKDFTTYPKNPLNKKMVIWGIYEQDEKELIGLCGLLTNDDNQSEIAYRLRKKYWKIGYGTEVTKHMIYYCFNTLKLNILTADVNIENTASVKILTKFFKPIKEFYNAHDKCTDRRYLLHKNDWKNLNQIK